MAHSTLGVVHQPTGILIRSVLFPCPLCRFTLQTTSPSSVLSCPFTSLALQSPGCPPPGLFLSWFFFLHPRQAFSEGHASESESPSPLSPFHLFTGMESTHMPVHPNLHTTCGPGSPYACTAFPLGHPDFTANSFHS